MDPLQLQSRNADMADPLRPGGARRLLLCLDLPTPDHWVELCDSARPLTTIYFCKFVFPRCTLMVEENAGLLLLSLLRRASSFHRLSSYFMNNPGYIHELSCIPLNIITLYTITLVMRVYIKFYDALSRSLPQCSLGGG